MSDMTVLDLRGVSETLLMPLYVRAIESQCPDALLRDEVAVALVAQAPGAFTRVQKIRMDEDDRVALIMRNRQMDHYAQDFLSRWPSAVVVHIGCGLDTRFARVDNGVVEWYDLDLPEVIALRCELIGGETGRYHHLANSVFNPAWLDTVAVHRDRPVLFLAEGVFMYFEEAQVKTLVLALRGRFPGAELVFDAFSSAKASAPSVPPRFSDRGRRSAFTWYGCRLASG